MLPRSAVPRMTVGDQESQGGQTMRSAVECAPMPPLVHQSRFLTHVCVLGVESGFPSPPSQIDSPGRKTALGRNRERTYSGH